MLSSRCELAKLETQTIKKLWKDDANFWLCHSLTLKAQVWASLA